MNDDRDQIMDNFFLAERLQGEEAAGRASIGPGLFYRFRYGSTAEAHTVGWAARTHFLLVRISGTTARVVPIGDDGQPLHVLAPDGTRVEPETTIERAG